VVGGLGAEEDLARVLFDSIAVALSVFPSTEAVVESEEPEPSNRANRSGFRHGDESEEASVEP
jgi:hypothetical protein